MGKGSEKAFFDNEYTQSPRAAVGQVYSIIRSREQAYERLIYAGVAGRRVLEYGGGTGSHSLEIARRGGLVTGIDISEQGIASAAARAEQAGVANVEYLVMDAEATPFPDRYFDLVIGEGILHHLNLRAAYREISRVLKPGGRAVFMEPLGHNPFLVLFRALTPKLRTPDEHPLLRGDLMLAREYFDRADFRFYHLSSFAALLFLKTRLFWPAVDFLDKVDATLFRLAPPAKYLAWYAIMILDAKEDAPILAS